MALPIQSVRFQVGHPFGKVGVRSRDCGLRNRCWIEQPRVELDFLGSAPSSVGGLAEQVSLARNGNGIGQGVDPLGGKIRVGDAHGFAPVSSLNDAGHERKVALDEVGLAFDRGEMNCQMQVGRSGPLRLGFRRLEIQLGANRPIFRGRQQASSEQAVVKSSPGRFGAWGREANTDEETLGVPRITLDVELEIVGAPDQVGLLGAMAEEERLASAN